MEGNNIKKEMVMSKPTITLWSDCSPEARQLREELEQGGFPVNWIFSGSPNILASYNGSFVQGYGEIHQYFLPRKK